jgi:hypothetical protein
MTIHIKHPASVGVICAPNTPTPEANVSTDPNGDRCVSCRSEIAKHPQLAILVARAAGIRVGDISLGVSDAELRRRAAKARTPKGSARNLLEIERRRELAERMK